MLSFFFQGKLAREITIGTATNQKATDVFREVVLRVWRASNSPDSLPDKLKPLETIEKLYEREMRIREMVGLNIPCFNPLNNSQTLLLNSTQNNNNTINGNKSINVNNSINVSNSMNLTGMLRSNNTANSTDNLHTSQNFGTLNLSGNRSAPNAPRLEQIPLGEQLHTPFNARELLWNGQPTL